MAADNEVKVNIKITSDGNGGEIAVGKISKISSIVKGLTAGLRTCAAAAKSVVVAFGQIGFFIEAVRQLYDVWKKFNEWLNRAARKVAEMRLAAVFKDASNAMDGLIRKQELYNRLLKQELDDLARRKELAQIEKMGEEETERVKRESIRTIERAQVTDPRERLDLEARYRLEDEQRERANREKEINRSIDEQFNMSAIYGSKAGAAERAADEAAEAARRLQENMISMNDQHKQDAEKQIAALKAREKSLRESAATYRAEEKQTEARIELYEKQRAANRSAPSLAAAQNEADRIKFEREEEKKRREEDVKSSKAANEFVKGYQAEVDASKREQIQSLTSFAGGLTSADAVSQNRLTAMGLGSGVRANGAVANDVHKLVDLLKQQIEATKNISTTPALQEGIFTD